MGTDRRFTGQKLDGTGLMYYQARYYDPAVGTFISPDTIVPDATSVFDYNRFMYVRGRAMNANDPSGHDPLDAAWESEFENNHGRSPTDQDRRDRLFSLMFLGSGSGGTWTAGDWSFYGQNKNSLWSGGLDWPNSGAPNLARFAAHAGRLASYYESDESDAFVSAFGLVFGSIPYGNPILSSLSMASTGALQARFDEFPPLYEGEEGWDPRINEHNQSHHYAGLFYTGYWFGSWSGIGVNWMRDGSLSGYNQADIMLGDGAARHGWALRRGYYSVQGVDDMIRIYLSDKGSISPTNWYPQ